VSSVFVHIFLQLC